MMTLLKLCDDLLLRLIDEMPVVGSVRLTSTCRYLRQLAGLTRLHQRVRLTKRYSLVSIKEHLHDFRPGDRFRKEQFDHWNHAATVLEEIHFRSDIADYILELNFEEGAVLSTTEWGYESDPIESEFETLYSDFLWALERCWTPAAAAAQRSDLDLNHHGLCDIILLRTCPNVHKVTIADRETTAELVKRYEDETHPSPERIRLLTHSFLPSTFLSITSLTISQLFSHDSNEVATDTILLAWAIQLPNLTHLSVSGMQIWTATPWSSIKTPLTITPSDIEHLCSSKLECLRFEDCEMAWKQIGAILKHVPYLKRVEVIGLLDSWLEPQHSRKRSKRKLETSGEAETTIMRAEVEERCGYLIERRKVKLHWKLGGKEQDRRNGLVLTTGK